MPEATIRTSAEILERLRFIQARDLFGVITGHLVFRLPFEDAKPFFKDGVTLEQFQDGASAMTPPIEAARDYLPFAWEKANNCRGLSAGRSLDHLNAWLWLAGYGEIVDRHWPDYRHYGKKQLVIASTLCDFDWRKADSGIWLSNEGDPPMSEAERDVEAEQGERIAMQASAAQAA